MMQTSRSQLIRLLEHTHPTLIRLTSSLPEPALDFHPEADAWSIRDILAHLVDGETSVIRARFERILKEDHPSLPPTDEKEQTAHRTKTRDALEVLLREFALQRAASLDMIKMVGESDWRREGYHPEYGHFTAQEWLGRWANHDTVHLRQIESTLEAFRRACSAMKN
jgi:hypothetical protein